MTLKQWLRHAFAVEGAKTPVTDEERLLVERLCREVVRRHLTTPAVTFAEMSRPLNYLSSQLMQFFSPVASLIFNTSEYQIFAKFLERRESIDIICDTLERMETEAEAQRKRTPE